MVQEQDGDSLLEEVEEAILTAEELRSLELQLLFWADVLSGVLAPVLVVYVLLVGNNRKIIGMHRLSLLVSVGLIVTVLVMTTAALLLFYGLATEQTGTRKEGAREPHCDPLAPSFYAVLVYCCGYC